MSNPEPAVEHLGDDQTLEVPRQLCRCGREFAHICIEMTVTGRPARAWYVSPGQDLEVDISSVMLDQSRWIISTGVAELRMVVGFRAREDQEEVASHG